MKPDQNQIKIYAPLIAEFKRESKSLYKNLWIDKKNDLSGLFIPHVFDNYYNSDNKTFFIGRDTYDYHMQLDPVFSQSEIDYLEENNKWPKSVNEIIHYTNNPYHFWNFVSRIQLALNNEDYSSLPNLSSSQKNIINQLGWGNLYSLELCETIKNRYGDVFYNSFDKDIYKQILELSYKISKLKNIIDAFNPNNIVILSWKDIEDWYLEGLDYQEIYCIDKLIAVYKIANSNTKIFWTYHPQSLKFKRVKPDDLIKIILEHR